MIDHHRLRAAKNLVNIPIYLFLNLADALTMPLFNLNGILFVILNCYCDCSVQVRLLEFPCLTSLPVDKVFHTDLYNGVRKEALLKRYVCCVKNVISGIKENTVKFILLHCSIN